LTQRAQRENAKAATTHSATFAKPPRPLLNAGVLQLRFRMTAKDKQRQHPNLYI
jgi:hypothetical protein